MGKLEKAVETLKDAGYGKDFVYWGKGMSSVLPGETFAGVTVKLTDDRFIDVACNKGTYGYEYGEYELAAMDAKHDLIYEGPFKNDTIGFVECSELASFFKEYNDYLTAPEVEAKDGNTRMLLDYYDER